MLMFVFVAGVLVVVAATAMRYVPQELYPITVFSVGLGTFLHQNLVTGFVVGADVQALYSTAQLLIEFQQWTPELTGSSISVPVVSLTPATVSLLTGLNLTTVFTVVNVVIFAFVPLLLYYLSNDVFSPEIGIFGCFFFIFSTTFHSPLRPVNNYLRDYLSSPSFLLYSSDKAPHSDEQSP